MTDTPIHVGLILDGNRRWAKQRRLPTLEGHRKGFDKLKDMMLLAEKKGIKHLTLYCLSVENLKRTKVEVSYLFRLLERGIKELSKSKELKEKRVKCNWLGRRTLLPEKLQKVLVDLEEQTKDNDGMTVNFCLAYDGQCEIVDAVKEIIKAGVDPETLNSELIKSFMYSKESPEIDLIIRTGMKDAKRLSGFMLWDSSYAEFKFRTDYWPDYNEEMFNQDLEEYASRHRRFGK